MNKTTINIMNELGERYKIACEKHSIAKGVKRYEYAGVKYTIEQIIEYLEEALDVKGQMTDDYIKEQQEIQR